MTTSPSVGNPPVPIDPEDEMALRRLADDGNPIHEDPETQLGEDTVHRDGEDSNQSVRSCS